MWNLWMKATKFGNLPSEVLRVTDSCAAWMLDTAVMWFGTTIENALAERVKVGVGANVEYKPRYTLALLLNPAFHLPRPIEDKYAGNPWGPLLALIGKKNSGVKMYKYVKPVD